MSEIVEPVLDGLGFREEKKFLVAVIMGSQSDWDQMQHACANLQKLGISYNASIVSAHRTPERMFDFARNAKRNGIEVIIAGAGGSAHLPGMTASLTRLPVLAVAIESASGEYKTVGAIGSSIFMPGGAPLFFMGVGKAGAQNAALGAAQILALKYQEVRVSYEREHNSMVASVAVLPEVSKGTPWTSSWKLA